MDQKTAAKLIAINSEFYQTFAAQFSSTRMRLQSGVLRVIETLPTNARILDLGCGNGELARTLATRKFQGSYTGLDFSAGLLEIARDGINGNPHFAFVQGDLGGDWEKSAFRDQSSAFYDTTEGKGSQTSEGYPSPITHHFSSFDIILAFATFHHIPSQELRLQIFNNIYNLLAPDGRFIHSNWQFLNSERLRKRIQPWAEIGLTDDAVDPGDYLLDWRQGGRGLRYAHHFSEEELAALAKKTRFNIIESFYSDGEGGNLGLYQEWKKRK